MKKRNLEDSLNDLKSIEMSDLLDSFGVRHVSVEVEEGAYFDRYKVRLSKGVKVSKIKSVIPEIGMHLRSFASPSGKICMSEGIYEIVIQTKPIRSPNMQDLISELDHEDNLIGVALGIDSDGERVSFDLNRIPNILIGGTTGSGKSVLLHNIILGCKFSSESKMFLVDPKRVEFSIYENFADGILKSAEEFKIFLSDLFLEMEKRYEVFERFKCRDISEFNSRFKTIAFRPIVVVVDEWADIYMSDPSIQNDLCKIAQKGRASGISFVLATQRPSTDIISGVIKANFPGRIALRVASGHDSRVILDSQGAENINEKGSGIFVDGSGTIKKFKTGYIKNIQEVLEWAHYLRL